MRLASSALDKYIQATSQGPLRLMGDKGLALAEIVGSISNYGCSTFNRGEMRRTQGDGSTTADKEYRCAANSSGTYGWRPVPLIYGTPATGEVLRYNGKEWVNVKPTMLAVAFLTREDPTAAAGNWVWTNMPAAATILYGANSSTYKRRIDLTYATQVRLHIDVAAAGVAGAKLYLRYSTDNSSFTDMTSASCTFGASTGVFTSGWQNLDTNVKGDVWVQVWGSGGDGAADPRFFTINAEFR